MQATRSVVTAYPCALPEDVISHYSTKLSYETDCADVYSAFADGEPDFVLLHATGTAETFARRHIPGAFHLPHRLISGDAISLWPRETVFVVYCAGPHCNGADQAALKLAQLGCKVKVMIGGMAGWADEGFAFAEA